MKAITTGFAITALAAAISGQAMAEAEFSYSGEINVNSTFDLLNDTRTNYIDDSDDDFYELSMDIAVSNGPFSGTISIVEDDAEITSDGSTIVTVGDLMVEDGAISFGQIGSVVATDDLIDALTDEAEDGLSYAVSGAARYTDAEMGLMVQGEGDSATGQRFGFAANLTQEIDMGTVYAEAQYREDFTNTALDTFIGAGAVLNVAEGVEVTAVYQSATTSAYGVGVVYTMDAMSFNASYGEPNADVADDEVIMVGGSLTADMLTFSGSYKMVADTTGDVEVDVDYANDNISANAGYAMSLVAGNDTTAIDLSVTMTAESGVEYKAAYDQNTDNAGADSVQALTVSAAYSF